MTIGQAIKRLRRAIEDASEQPRLEADLAEVLAFLQEQRRLGRARARKAMAFESIEVDK